MREEEVKVTRERERERGLERTMERVRIEEKGGMCPVVRGWGDQYCRNTP